MKKSIFLLFFIALLSLTGCKTTMKVKGIPQKKLPALVINTPVVIFEEEDSLPTNHPKTYIGSFKIRDGGTTLDCNYERVLEIAKAKARKVGGNAIKITQHKLPSIHWSTCHRINFQVWKLQNTRPYEKQMIWNTNRKLSWKEFQGKPEKQAPSFLCGKIRAQFQGQNFFNGKGHISVMPIVEYDCSWVQADYKLDSELTYNRVKFDLLELYARKMRKAFTEAHIKTRKDWNKKAPEIYTEIGKAYKKEVHQLDKETYYGTYPMGVWRWSFLTHQKLKNLQQYASD